CRDRRDRHRTVQERTVSAAIESRHRLHAVAAALSDRRTRPGRADAIESASDVLWTESDGQRYRGRARVARLREPGGPGRHDDRAGRPEGARDDCERIAVARTAGRPDDRLPTAPLEQISVVRS